VSDVRVAVALIVRDARILVQQRATGSHLAGTWEFPGGKLEPDESWEEALAREVQEELGVVGHAAGIVEEKTFEYPEKRVRIRFYWTVIEGEPKAGRWVSARELLSLEVPEANKELLPRIAQVLESQTYSDEAPARERGFGLVAWMLILVPVAFVVAGLIFLTIDNLVAAQHRDLGKVLEGRFPVARFVGGSRAIFFGIFLVAEAALVAWVHRATQRR
jgi:8-oxo-dGTP diphosphatase